MFYAHIRNNKILDATGSKYLNNDILNIVISEETAENIQNYKFVAPDKIIPKTEDEIEAQKAEEQRQKRIAEIKAELEELDRKTIRPLRAGETEKVEEFEQDAWALRNELQKLKYQCGNVQGEDVEDTPISVSFKPDK